MIAYSNTRVYRKDWDFRVGDTLDYFASDNLIKNDDVDGSEELDYMELEDYSLCSDLDDALYALEFDLEDILGDRVSFEYDMDNTTINEMAAAIRADWNERCLWTDAIEILADINNGMYDDEMQKYYVYLQVGAIIENLYLYDFNTSDQAGLVGVLAGNDIYVGDDEVDFAMGSVRESVDRTDELVVDVSRLLENVLTELKGAGSYLDFNKYY